MNLSVLWVEVKGEIKGRIDSAEESRAGYWDRIEIEIGIERPKVFRKGRHNVSKRPEEKYDWKEGYGEKGRREKKRETVYRFLPSSFMPTSRHFWNLQNGQRFLCVLSMWHERSATHVYTFLFWTVRLKNPLHDSHVNRP